MSKEDYLEKIVKGNCLFIIIFSVFILGSWFFKMPFLAGLGLGYVPMAPSTAVIFLLVSSSLLIYTLKKDVFIGRIVGRGGAVLVFILSVILLTLSLIGIRSDYEHPFLALPDKVNQMVVGHISPLTAGCFMFSGVSLSIIFFTRNLFLKNLAGVISTGIFLTGLILFLGYFYHAPFLYDTEIIPVALTTAIAFMSLGMALVAAAGRAVYPLKIFYGDPVYSRLMQVFLPLTAVLTIINGWLFSVIYPLLHEHVFITLVISVISILTIAFLISRISAGFSRRMGELDQEIIVSGRKERESEIKFQSLIQAAASVIITLSLDRKILEFNPEAERLYGKKRSEVLGKDYFELFLPREDWGVVGKDFKKVLSGEPTQGFENKVLTAEGRDRIFRWSVNRIMDRDEAIGVVAIGQDITERRLAEEDLKTFNSELRVMNRIMSACSSIRNLKEIMENILDEVISLTGLEGGTICLVNEDNVLTLLSARNAVPGIVEDFNNLKIKAGECLCGQCALDHKPLILPDREAIVKFSTREILLGDKILFHASFPLMTGKKCVGVLCLFTRSERKPLPRSLSLVENIALHIALTIENSLLYEEILANSRNLENRVRERTAAIEEMNRQIRASRKAMVNVVEDLGRKTRELEIANSKLQEMDRLKSIFIASMSHELRTPLNSVIGFSSVLLNDWAGPVSEEQKDLLNSISRSGKHLLALINEIIDISKIEAGKVDVVIEEFDLKTLVVEAVDSLMPEIKEKGLELKMDTAEIMMRTDRKRLFQAVLNLLSNAVKFTGKGGVSVSAGIKDRGFVEIRVGDSGVGIRPEDIPRLFKPFERLEHLSRPAVTGTGLGLYLTKKLTTEILKGEIEVLSEFGKGSTFILRIPKNI